MCLLDQMLRRGPHETNTDTSDTRGVLPEPVSFFKRTAAQGRLNPILLPSVLRPICLAVENEVK